MQARQSIANSLRSGWFLLFAAAFPFLTPATHAQAVPNDGPSVAFSTGDSGFVDLSGMDPVKNRMMRAMVRQRKALRQKTIVDDTAQLLELAQQLKAAIDKSNQDQLSLKAVDTAAEIEKLAKTVEKTMRGDN